MDEVRLLRFLWAMLKAVSEVLLLIALLYAGLALIYVSLPP